MDHSPGDSNIDEQCSLMDFMAWARNMTGNQSVAEESTLQKDLQQPGSEVVQAKKREPESETRTSTAEEYTESEAKKSVKTKSPELSLLQAKGNIALSTGKVDEHMTPVSIPAISVAHKAGRKDDTFKADLTAINKLDFDSEEQVKRLSTSTPSQKMVLQEHDLKTVEEQRDRETTTASGKDEAYNQPNELANGQRQYQYQHKIQEIEKPAQDSQKATGLLDSIHARKNFRPRMPPGGRPQHQISLPNQDSILLQADGNKKRDPMRYYDDKQKEYYPPARCAANSAKPMLQSKDPNLLMKTPRKTSTGLNPQAAEYKLARSEQSSAETVVNAAELQVERVPTPPAHPEAKRTPSRTLSDQLDPGTVTSISSLSTEDMADPTSTEQSQPKRALTNSDVSCSQSQGDRRSEKGFDLTPMLNVLGARIVKGPDTVASEGSADKELPHKIETDESTLDVTAQDLSNRNVAKAEASRTLMLKNLPNNCDYTLVQSMIQGAVVLKMALKEEEQYAYVKLASADECRRLLELYGTGKVIKHKGKMHTIHFELSSEPDEQDDILDAYLECGATRAIEVEDVDLDVTMRALFQLGQGPTPSRVVEAINDSFSGGARSVVFRFISIYDAVGFRSSLRRTDGWKEKSTQFAQDPCA